MMEDDKPVPQMLFLNQAFLHSNAEESSETTTEIKQEEDDQSYQFSLLNSSLQVKTEECDFDGGLSNPSNEENPPHNHESLCGSSRNEIVNSTEGHSESDHNVSLLNNMEHSYEKHMYKMHRLYGNRSKCQKEKHQKPRLQIKMPRKLPSWSQESLQKAIKAVGNGMGKRKAAKTFSIPWGTFSDKLSGRRKLDGTAAQTVLTLDEERELVKFIKSSSERGFVKTKEELMVTVQSMLNFRGRKTKWVDNMPQKKWFRLFKKRFPEIVLRSKRRALATKEKLLKWFQDFAECLKSKDATILQEPDRIYNCDESGFHLDASSGKVLSFFGTKFVYQVGCEERLMITVLACCSASGHFVWPMMIYPGKGKVFGDIQPSDVFQEAYITTSDNGWTNQSIFNDWLETVFIPQTQHIKKPLLLLVDGHVSHMSMRAAEICIENDIILYGLPPHASHIVQPLDVGVFRTMENEWHKAVKQQNQVEIVTKCSFANVFKLAYENTVSRHLAAQAFKSSGLYPLDPSNIMWEKLLPNSCSIPAGYALKEENINPTPLISATLFSDTLLTVAPFDHTTTLPATSAVPVAASSASPVPVAATSATSTSSVTITACTTTSSATPVATSALPIASFITDIATTSSHPYASKDRASALRKFALISAQVGETTLNKYFECLEEGSDCHDPAYELWKTYHEEIMDDTQVSIQSKHPCPIPKDPLPIQSIPKGPLPIQSIPKGPLPIQSIPKGPLPIQPIPKGPLPIQSIPKGPLPIQAIPKGPP